MDFTFEPYEHPPAPVMTAAEERAWCEPYMQPMDMAQRAQLHGISEDSYEQMMLSYEQHSLLVH